MLHERFFDAVQYLHPGVSFLTDVRIQDDGDGRGPYVVDWGLPGHPPTDKEIDALLPILNAPPPVKTPLEKFNAVLRKIDPTMTPADIKAAIAAAKD